MAHSRESLFIPEVDAPREASSGLPFSSLITMLLVVGIAYSAHRFTKLAACRSRSVSLIPRHRDQCVPDPQALDLAFMRGSLVVACGPLRSYLTTEVSRPSISLFPYLYDGRRPLERLSSHQFSGLGTTKRTFSILGMSVGEPVHGDTQVM
jgi:hypothetical protein